MRQVPGYALWLGHAGNTRDLRALHAAGISAVVDLAVEEPIASLTREFVYCRFPLIDGAGNPRWLLRVAVETVAHLLRGGVPTLVSCGAGMSRTPAVAGAALALVRGCSPVEGLTLVSRSGVADVLPALWADIEVALGHGASRVDL